MRRNIRVRSVLLAMTALMAIGAMAPASTVAAAPPVPRVVVIVGPSGAATERYRVEARAAAEVARDFTTDVTELYSPNATWPAVRDALQGASLVIYMGHGNGWPSHYRDQLYPPTQNGLGLNPKPGGDDSAHQYFGEARLEKDIHLAKHAVVLLHHLCYASGLSEPGLPEGTLDEAKQRVDNFAAGFIAAGAEAVIAEAYSSPARYVAAILGGRRSIDTIWRKAPNANGHLLAFESSRSPGFLAQMDPASSDSGFERSIVLKRGLVPADVLAGASGSPHGPFIADPLLPSLVQTGILLKTPTLAGLTLAGSTLTLRIPYVIDDRGRLPESIAASLRWEAIDRPATNPDDPPPKFHLVTPETPGTVVEPATLKMAETKLGLPVKLPDVPGTYRLSVTLHDDTGLAFDAATQALLPALLVRVTGEVDGAVLAPPATTVVPGTDATTMAVDVVNLGTSPWGREAVPTPFGRPVERRVTAILVGHVVPLAGANAAPVADIRVRLPAGLAPRATASLTLDLKGLTDAGDYLLLLDVEIPDQGSLTALGLPPTIVRVHVDAPPTPIIPDAPPTGTGPA